ncbi:MAG TPA: DUF6345 domain-containing protein [bacterium]|nr:DUF6345 domain-containing protein [bacterium]
MNKMLMFLIIFLISSFAYATYYIGAKSENTWENNWKDPWRGNDVCSYWYSTMGYYSSIDQISYTSLGSAKTRYETDGDQNSTYGLDAFDIYLHCGHSGHYYTSNDGVHNAQWHMWNEDTRALSKNMRLGDETRELKLFSTYGCAQMYDEDGHRLERWNPIFKGGLKFATGFWELAWLFGSDYTSNRQLGIDYAQYLNTTNKTVKYAWWDAVKEHPDNKPAVLASGASQSNAASRRDNMRMVDLPNYSVLRDGDVDWLGWTQWR